MRNVRRVLIGLVASLAFLGMLAVAPSGAPALAAESCGGQPCTWNFGQIKVTPAQPLGNRGAGVTVAVVDTWIDNTHPELRDRIIGHATCFEAEGGCQTNTQSRDECTHGTHVAGTVASTNYGVASQADILGVQVLTYDGGTCSGSAEDVAAGIRFATSQGVGVINLSVGSLVPGLFQSQAVSDAVNDAARAGAVVVFAAGNSTVPLSDDYNSDALLVAATGPGGRLASYSSRGGAIDLAAPGGDSGAGGLTSCSESTCILSTEPKGAYALRKGTSMAAPHVAGTAALLLAQDRQRGRADVVAALRKTARPLSGVQYGLIDAEAALRSGVRPSASVRAPATRASSSEARRPDTGNDGSAESTDSAPKTTRSGIALPGTGPNEPDLGEWGVAGDAGSGDLETFSGEALPSQAPLVERQPQPDDSTGTRLLGVAAVVAVVMLLVWVAMSVFGNGARKRSTERPDR